MHYTLSILTALFLLGCGDAPQHDPEKSEAKQETMTETEQPSGLKKTVAPALVKHEESPKIATESKEEVISTIEKSVNAMQVPIQKTVVNGAVIFQKCTACHGLKAEKVALGKSQIIAGWDAAKISEALNGYKDGSYGGAMKALMQAQVKSLSDEEIDAVSEHISSF